VIAALLAAKTTVNPGAITVPDIRYLAILPELVLLGGAVLLLAVASLVRRPLRVTVATTGTLVISVAALVTALWQWVDVQNHGAYTTIDKAVVCDGFSVLVTITVACAMILVTLVGDGYLRREGVDGAEFHVLAMISAAGAMIMGEANDLIIIFLGLEILSIALYVLVAFNHRRTASGEAALKYFVLGAFSSAIFVYGIALTYGATGSTNLNQISDFLARNTLLNDGLLLAGLGLVLVGFAFKIAAVPFHMWTPDVYQGAPSPVTGFMAAVAKVGGFAALLRVFLSSFGTLESDWRPIVVVLAVLSLLGGAVLALVQRDVKRMLAYSSINHAGFILLGVAAGTAAGVSGSLYYLFAYTVMTIGTFAVVTVLGGRGDRNHDIDGYRGLAGRQPLVALCLAVLLLAQAGAPFTTGLWAKLQVVSAAIDAGQVPLAVIAMVSAAIAAFFYLRLAALMYAPGRSAGAEPGTEPAVGDRGTGEIGARTPLAIVPGHATLDDADPAERPNLVPADLSGAVATTTRANAVILLDEDAAAPDEVDEPAAAAPAAVAFPVLTAVVIGVCVGVTVLFGIWPAPLVEFAHRATLLFIGT
jgi:NADH-quinone oxidoreductase subunit N